MLTGSSKPSCLTRLPTEFGADRKAIVVIAEEIRSLIPPADISEVMGAVEDLLDESIVPTKEGYVIREPASGGAVPGFEQNRL